MEPIRVRQTKWTCTSVSTIAHWVKLTLALTTALLEIVVHAKFNFTTWKIYLMLTKLHVCCWIYIKSHKVPNVTIYNLSCCSSCWSFRNDFKARSAANNSRQFMYISCSCEPPVLTPLHTAPHLERKASDWITICIDFRRMVLPFQCAMWCCHQLNSSQASVLRGSLWLLYLARYGTKSHSQKGCDNCYTLHCV